MPWRKRNCVADIALAAGVRTHDDGKWSDAQGLVGEVLEVDESERGNHVSSPSCWTAGGATDRRPRAPACCERGPSIARSPDSTGADSVEPRSTRANSGRRRLPQFSVALLPGAPVPASLVVAAIVSGTLEIAGRGSANVRQHIVPGSHLTVGGSSRQSVAKAAESADVIYAQDVAMYPVIGGHDVSGWVALSVRKRFPDAGERQEPGKASNGTGPPARTPSPPCAVVRTASRGAGRCCRSCART